MVSSSAKDECGEEKGESMKVKKYNSSAPNGEVQLHKSVLLGCRPVIWMDYLSGTKQWGGGGVI